MHFVYVIYSEQANKYYVGETDNIELRLSKHNNHSYQDSFTKIAEDWKVVLLFNCVSREQAIRLEKFIKKMKSKVFIQKVIINPSILEDIISKNNF
jgi:putative endonuclease